jgi:hypothetical protein
LNKEDGFMGSQTNKAMDASIAELLWPEYLRTGGNVKAVTVYAKSEGIKISRPTVKQMEENFDWMGQLKIVRKNSFVASVDHGSEIAGLLKEITEQKNAIKKLLKASPTDLKLHGQYGDYIAQIVSLQKQMIAAKQINKEALLGDAMNATVSLLIDMGHNELAEVLADNLETIADKVKEKWAQQL